MVKISAIPANSDERGFGAEFEQNRTGKHIFLYRKAGSSSRNHYHKGISPTKNPEILFVIQGKCTLKWFHIDDRIEHTEQIEGPTRIEIPAYVSHVVTMQTDCVLMELNSIEEHIADTFYT